MFYEKKLKNIFYVLNILPLKNTQMYRRMFSSSLNLVYNGVKTFSPTFGPPQCKNCKHFVPHTGPAPDLGRCKLLGYHAITCRTHWLSTISCGFEARFFEPK
jgi:hypothetical protein